MEVVFGHKPAILIEIQDYPIKVLLIFHQPKSKKLINSGQSVKLIILINFSLSDLT